MAESDQLTLDPSVAPAGILAGHPQHQGPDRRWRWVVGLVVGAGRSSGGRRVGRASAAGFGVTPAAAGAAEAGSSLLSALSTARSSQVSAGRAFVRRSTATS